jgi:hypothetical protein
MNDKEKTDYKQLRQDWIESLLVSATARQDHEDRIARAMRHIGLESPASTQSVAPGRNESHPVRWAAMGVAATLLLALFLVAQNFGTSRSAMAAVERSLNVAAQRTARKYVLQLEYRTANGNKLQIDNELFVQGNERFALRHPGLLPGTSFWLGQDGSEAWVLPAFGPVRKGDNTVLSRWLRSRQALDTPYLHVTTLLTRMSRGYRLEKLADEEVAMPDGATAVCRHVRGKLKAADQPNLPDTVELWASRETGVAVRMVARWQLAAGEFGRQKLVLAFQHEEPSLADDWFTAEGHLDGRRPVMRVNSPDN